MKIYLCTQFKRAVTAYPTNKMAAIENFRVNSIQWLSENREYILVTGVLCAANEVQANYVTGVHISGPLIGVMAKYANELNVVESVIESVTRNAREAAQGVHRVGQEVAVRLRIADNNEVQDSEVLDIELGEGDFNQ